LRIFFGIRFSALSIGGSGVDENGAVGNGAGEEAGGAGGADDARSAPKQP